MLIIYYISLPSQIDVFESMSLVFSGHYQISLVHEASYKNID